MLLLTNRDVEQLLDMKTCLEALEVGYQDMVRNDATYRPRSGVIVASASSSDEFPDAHFLFGSMEGACRSIGVFAIRMKSDITYTQNGRRQKYCVEPGTYCGLVMLFSVLNGEPLAIIQDGYIQHMRVGGCAGLGAKYLARLDASVVGILGSGGMARTYLRAFSLVRQIRKVKVYSTTPANREAYAAEMNQRFGIPVEPLDNPEAVVRGSDIVATCTDAVGHIVRDPSWIENGMHLTNNTAGEWAPAVLERCDVRVRLGWASVQSPEPGTTRVGGESVYVAGQPEELALLSKGRPELPEGVGSWPLLTDILAGRAKGRTGPEQVTFFDNHGSQGLQFASVGGRVYQMAKEAGIGREIPTEWILQDIRD